MCNFAALLLFSLLSSCFAATSLVSYVPSYGPANNGSVSILDYLIQYNDENDLTTFSNYRNQIPDLFRSLNASGPFTVFVPIGPAFGNLQAADLNQLNQDKASLKKLLSYHVFNGAIDFNTAPPTQFIKTLANLTMLVQSDGISTFSVSSGVSTAFLNSTSFYKATNGYIYFIDNLLLLPTVPSVTATQVGATEFSKNLAVARLTNIVDNLPPPITIFAPSNEAFAAFYAYANANNITVDGNLMTAILELHIVQGLFFSTTIKNTTVRSSYNGLNETIVKINSSVSIIGPSFKANNSYNTANVISFDSLISNGVYQFVDAVLLPDLTLLQPFTSPPSFVVGDGNKGVPFPLPASTSSGVKTVGSILIVALFFSFF